MGIMSKMGRNAIIHIERPISRIGTHAVSKNNSQGISWRYTQYKLNAWILLGEQVLTLSLSIKRVRLNWNFIVYDVQNATYSSHGPLVPHEIYPHGYTREWKYVYPYGQYANIRKDILRTSRIRGNLLTIAFYWRIKLIFHLKKNGKGSVDGIQQRWSSTK